MILNPAIIAMLSGSLLVGGYAVYASIIGIQILRGWDLHSGSSTQLMLERKTYLVSTICTYLLIFELLSLFLFVYTADHMHGLFVGAMCAAGTLNVNAYGYPLLVLKILIFVFCGVWIIVNYVDNKGFDYPLIKRKYKFLFVITGLIVLEAVFQINYFRGLIPNVITSCCGAVFSEEASTVAGKMSALSPYPTRILFYLTAALTLRTGIHFLATGRGASLFSGLSVWMMILSAASIISFISVYYYQLPTHHCPFCILQKEYGYIGYPMYLSLLTAGVTGLSTGVIDRFKGSASLAAVIPPIQKMLSIISMIGVSIFIAISTYPIIFSDFKLEGY